MNLVERLGTRYFQEFFNRAIVVHEGKAHILRDVMESDRIFTIAIDLEDDSSRPESSVIPFDAIQDFTSMAWPKLGYRNFILKDVRTFPMSFPVYVTQNRSVLRGIRLDNLRYETPAIFQASRLSYADYIPLHDEGTLLRALYRPKFPSAAEGMSAIREGKWLGFALNEDFLVTLSVSGNAGVMCDILFKETVVGSIREDGTVELFNKVLHKSTLLQGLSL